MSSISYFQNKQMFKTFSKKKRLFLRLRVWTISMILIKNWQHHNLIKYHLRLLLSTYMYINVTFFLIPTSLTTCSNVILKVNLRISSVFINRKRHCLFFKDQHEVLLFKLRKFELHFHSWNFYYQLVIIYVFKMKN